MPILKTYTFYLRDGGEQPAGFEPLLCRTNDEIVAKALDLLARNPHCHAVDVYFGDTELLSLKQPER